MDQTTIITEQHNFLQTTLELLQADLFENLASSSSPVSMSTSKCVVFFPTARQVGFAAEAFEQLKARLTSDQSGFIYWNYGEFAHQLCCS